MSCSRSGVGKWSARAGVTNVVLDSSALLAYLNGEPGCEIVAGIIADSLISSVNLAETITKLVERAGSLEAARAVLDVIELDVRDFDRSLAERTGELVTRTRRSGLSLGDRACLALAARQGVLAITADRSLAALADDVQVRLIR